MAAAETETLPTESRPRRPRRRRRRLSRRIISSSFARSEQLLLLFLLSPFLFPPSDLHYGRDQRSHFNLRRGASEKSGREELVTNDFQNGDSPVDPSRTHTGEYDGDARSTHFPQR